MRKTLAFFYLLVIAGFACIAHAQLTQTGAGKFGSGGGGGFTPCAGTAIHVLDPNNLTTSNWNNVGLNVFFNATDPNLVPNNATDLSSNNSGGSFNAAVFTNAIAVFPMTGGVTYSFGAYLKSIIGPVWVMFQVSDAVTFSFGSWFDLVTPAVGTSNIAGAGSVLSCAVIGASTNGYMQVSIAGHIASTSSTMRLEFYLVNGNGTSTTTLNQEIYAWQVSP